MIREKNQDFNSLFHLNEYTSQEILQPEEQIKDAIIVLQKNSLMEYYRYCKEQFDKTVDSNQRQLYLQELSQTSQQRIAIDPHYQQA
jgi:DNA primase